MALDWSKEISFSGLKNRPAKQKTEYPSKTYMNLMVVDKRTIDVRKAVPTAIILAIVVALVVKFGILDFYGRVDAKHAELASQQQSLNALRSELTNYDAVLEEYEGYESISASEEGLSVDAVEALGLVDRYVAPSARVASISLSGDTMSLNLADVTLDGVGQLVSVLYEQAIVKNVSVSTAATQQTASPGVVATMTITLAPADEGGSAGAGSSSGGSSAAAAKK
ncbi:MAG TPA: hypothetical protein DCP91_08910 [Eggerthellaceae bacterium]|nr:hypothetical protein [Eggerthellaceae bacterium]